MGPGLMGFNGFGYRGSGLMGFVLVWRFGFWVYELRWGLAMGFGVAGLGLRVDCFFDFRVYWL